MEMKDGRMGVSNCTEVVGSFSLNCHQALLSIYFWRIYHLCSSMARSACITSNYYFISKIDNYY